MNIWIKNWFKILGWQSVCIAYFVIPVLNISTNEVCHFVKFSGLGWQVGREVGRRKIVQIMFFPTLILYNMCLWENHLNLSLTNGIGDDSMNNGPNQYNLGLLSIIVGYVFDT